MVSSPVWIIGKEELIENDPPFFQQFRNFDTMTSGVLYNHRATPAPVENLEGGEEPQYFLGVDPGNSGGVLYPRNNEQDDLTTVWDEITVHAITWSGANPIRHDFRLALPEGYTYRIPINSNTANVGHFQPSPAGSHHIRVHSARFWSAPVLRDGHIWATHHVRRANNHTHEVRWYRITLNDWPNTSSPGPEIEEDAYGTIAVNESGSQAIFPSVGVNFWGDMVVSYTEGGKDSGQKFAPRLFVRSWDDESNEYAWIKNDQDVGVLTEDLSSASIRWGDYSGTEADPTDWCVFWTYTMWCNNSSGGDEWSTWLSRNYMTDLCEQEFGPDYSRNGTVDAEDAAIFDTLYDEQDRRADYNRDRTVDGLDYVSFLQAYSRTYR